MNSVFYSLSLAVICVTAWLLYSVSLPVAVVVWALGTICIFFDDIIFWVARADHALKIHSLRKQQQGSLSFGPIESPIAAHFAQQITKKMTIEQIEQLVTDSESHQGIHARTNKIER